MRIKEREILQKYNSTTSDKKTVRKLKQESYSNEYLTMPFTITNNLSHLIAEAG